MKRGSLAARFLVAAVLVAAIVARMWRADWKRVLGIKPEAEHRSGLSQPSEDADADAAKVEESIEFSDRFGRVENGSAYDRASVEVGTAKKVVLPQGAIVRRTTELGEVQLFMKKTMQFFGDPDKPMSIRDARKKMGCAVKREGDALVIAAYGESDAHSEGGAHVRIVAIVPLNVEIEWRGGLSGPTNPAKEWTAVPDAPDPDLIAKYRR
jgi:hypothetical protein